MNFDVDIDIQPNTNKDKYGVKAIIHDEDSPKIKDHPSGYYVDTNIPVDGMTGKAAIDYKEADKIGYIKIDMLNNTAYSQFKTKEDVLYNLRRKTNWKRLMDEEFVKQLPHIGNHFDLVYLLEPESIDDLADVLALMRPGKIGQLKAYTENKEEVRKTLYDKPKTGYFFKKGHAYAYAGQLICIINKLSD